MKTTMELADAYARAMAEERHSIDFEPTAKYVPKINTRIEARAALAQRIEQLEKDGAVQARHGMYDGLNMALAVVEVYGMSGGVIYTHIKKLRDEIDVELYAAMKGETP
jgi:hypothetical protein